MLSLIKALVQKGRKARYDSGRLAIARRDAVTKGAVFAQQFEDRIAEILLGRVGSFIDVGANDGLTFSNTFYFAELGARGLCFEPLKQAFHTLSRVHRHREEVVCICGALGATAGTGRIRVEGYEGLLSTLASSEKAGEQQEGTQEASVYPLSFWLKQYPQFAKVDLLSIDVEGFETEVLAGIDFDEFTADLIIIETDDPRPDVSNGVVQRLRGKGYSPVIHNNFNTFLLRDGDILTEQKRAEIERLSPFIKCI